MSYTEIYGINIDGDVIYVNETENAWNGAMHVWNSLLEKYNIQGGIFSGYKELWGLADTGKLTDVENFVLKATFDNVIVKKKDIPLLIECFKVYDENFPNSTLLEQAEIIEKEILNNEEMIGVCWNQTSVNSNPWVCEYDDDDDEDIPYNVTTGDRHWVLKEKNWE